MSLHPCKLFVVDVAIATVSPSLFTHIEADTRQGSLMRWRRNNCYIEYFNRVKQQSVELWDKVIS